MILFRTVWILLSQIVENNWLYHNKIFMLVKQVFKLSTEFLVQTYFINLALKNFHQRFLHFQILFTR